MSKKLFEKLEAIFNEHLSLDSDPDYLKVVFGTIIANRLDTLPVWLMIIARASSGKSEVACSMSGCDEIYIASKVNKKAFISHAPKTKDNPKECSLLPQLDGKVMIIPDASTLSTIHPNERAEVFAILRSAFDGEYSDISGMGGKSFKSKFGLILCATPAFEHMRTFDGALGERFVNFRPRTSNPNNSEEIWEKVKTCGNDYSEMKHRLALAAIDFLDKVKVPTKILYPDEIFHLSQFLAVLRSEVIRDNYTREIAFPVSQGELPIRVGKQLCALYTAMRAFTRENDALNIIRRIVRDSIPYVRLYTLFAIMNGCDTADKIATRLKVSSKTCYRILEEMVLLNVLNVAKSDQITEPAIYSISEIFMELFRVRPLS